MASVHQLERQPDSQHHHNNHGHNHHHGHDDEETGLSERNRAHWNAHAATYNSAETQRKFGDLINKVNTLLLNSISWIGVDFLDPSSTFEKPSPKDQSTSAKQVRVLDYACGPGTITAALASYASEFVGIDASEGMVEQYNKRFSHDSSTQGHASSEPSVEVINAKAVQGDLLIRAGPSQSTTGPEFYDFDLAVVGLGFHHFPDLALATSRLAERLKPGGVLMIVDFLSHAHNDMGEDISKARIVAHHGFTDDQVHTLFSGAGLIDIELKLMSEDVVFEGTQTKRKVFLAKGRKPV